MNREEINSRYTHCLCLHVRPATIFIGFVHLTQAILSIVGALVEYGGNDLSNYPTRNTGYIHRRSETSFNLMFNTMVAIVSGMVLYGVHKNRPSYLMPFFVKQLYSFFCSVPTVLTQRQYLSNYKRHPEAHFSNSNVLQPPIGSNTSGQDVSNNQFIYDVMCALLVYIYRAYFICVVWKCYRYLKLKEMALPLRLPYIGPAEVIVPPNITSSMSANIAPPDYETATKQGPPPDYDAAIKYQTYAATSCTDNNSFLCPPQGAPPDFNVTTTTMENEGQNNTESPNANVDTNRVVAPPATNSQGGGAGGDLNTSLDK